MKIIIDINPNKFNNIPTIVEFFNLNNVKHWIFFFFFLFEKYSFNKFYFKINKKKIKIDINPKKFKNIPTIVEFFNLKNVKHWIFFFFFLIVKYRFNTLYIIIYK